MAHKRKDNFAGGAGGAKNSFPAEAYACNDDLSEEVIRKMREEVGVDVKGDEWETLDGLGQVVRA